MVVVQDQATKQLQVKPGSSGRTINSWDQWERAFRTFMAIYIAKFPKRTIEIMHYQNLIQSAALKFPWELVSNYDRLFRNYIAEIPGKRWDEMDVQTYIQELVGSASTQLRSTPKGSKSEQQPCRLFNKNKCGWGDRCKYLHKCMHCNKMGHSKLDCRKLSKEKSDKE
jgi:hypothetical protein